MKRFLRIYAEALYCGGDGICGGITMSIELKPCPFCGGEARRYFGKIDFHGIVCKKCSAKVYGYGSQGAATKAWNRRADNG